VAFGLCPGARLLQYAAGGQRNWLAGWLAGPHLQLDRTVDKPGPFGYNHGMSGADLKNQLFFGDNLPALREQSRELTNTLRIVR
jgi:hypothetical protein